MRLVHYLHRFHFSAKAHSHPYFIFAMTVVAVLIVGKSLAERGGKGRPDA
jgi:hypothetical protein